MTPQKSRTHKPTYTRRSRPTITPHAVDTIGAGEYTGYSPHTLKKWRRTGGGPRFIRVNRSARYLFRDLDAWMDSLVVRTTA